MKTAVYPGSFNPLHIGHLAILRYLTSKMDFDQVYLIVSPQNPFKGKDMLLSGQERFEAAVRAVARHRAAREFLPGHRRRQPPVNQTMEGRRQDTHGIRSDSISAKRLRHRKHTEEALGGGRSGTWASRLQDQDHRRTHGGNLFYGDQGRHGSRTRHECIPHVDARCPVTVYCQSPRLRIAPSP